MDCGGYQWFRDAVANHVRSDASIDSSDNDDKKADSESVVIFEKHFWALPAASDGSDREASERWFNMGMWRLRNLRQLFETNYINYI